MFLNSIFLSLKNLDDELPVPKVKVIVRERDQQQQQQQSKQSSTVQQSQPTQQQQQIFGKSLKSPWWEII